MERKTLPFEFFSMKLDQIALYTESTEDAVKAYQEIGYDNWVIDKVEAVDRMTNWRFKVDLAFNYEIYPCEFELISVRMGSTVQIPAKSHIDLIQNFYCGMSHYGFHVDDLPEKTAELVASGFNLLADVETVGHAGTSNLYRYAFLDTSKFGFISKLISRKED
jgi:hypothetical protein